jgi:hypothetical protein
MGWAGIVARREEKREKNIGRKNLKEKEYLGDLDARV